MFKTFKLSENDLKDIDYQLSVTPKLMSDPEFYADELADVQHTLPLLIPNSLDKYGKTFHNYGPEETITVYYTSKSKELNYILSSIFDIPSDAQPFYTSVVSYHEGGGLKQHYDPYSDLTTNILLGDEFEPGHLYINNKLVDFYERGQALSFHGKVTGHRVTPVKKGLRRTLSVWYKIPSIYSKHSLI